MALADRLVVGSIQVAPLGKGVAARLGVRTGAFAARDVDLQGRVAVVAVEADLAVSSL